jgi:hypothetical protein
MSLLGMLLDQLLSLCLVEKIWVKSYCSIFVVI